MFSREVTEYKVFAYGGTQTPSGKIRALISLKVADPPTNLGPINLLFHPDDVQLPQNTESVSTDGKQRYVVHYPYSQYAGVLDLLRNEKPVYFQFGGILVLPPMAFIYTSNEPVGEGEP